MKYSDSSSLGRRHYELREASIHVRGTQTNGDSFEVEIPYKQINPFPEKLRVYSPFFRLGLCFFVFGVLALCLMRAMDFAGKGTFFSAALGLVVFGAVMALLGLKKIEMIRFNSTAGVPCLAVIRAGRYKSHYQSFVSELQNRIEHS